MNHIERNKGWIVWGFLPGVFLNNVKKPLK